MNAPTTKLTLSGLQGSNLLGFLASLGAFRTLAEMPETSRVQMRWAASGGSYCPILQLPVSREPKTIVADLHAALREFSGHYVITVEKDLKIPRASFRQIAHKAAEDFLSHNDPTAAAMIAAFGCDTVCNEEGLIEDTGFRTMSGAGHQHFLKFMDVLAQETTVEQLQEALFGPWRYRDSSPTMRWDAEDDRRYALRWDEPSKDPVRTVRGANRLAIAALPLFPVVPTSGTSIATTGFNGKNTRDTFVNWPIWSGWLGLDAVRSLLNLKASQDGHSILSAREPLGIAAVYRSQRITLGKYRNFTPAQSVME